MNINDIVIGDRILVRRGRYIKEHARILAILDNGNILVKLSDNSMSEINPQFILKTFGQL